MRDLLSRVKNRRGDTAGQRGSRPAVTESRQRGHSSARGASRWRGTVAAVAGAAVLVGVAVTPHTQSTLASWTDSEWTSGSLGVLDCADPLAGSFTTRSEGTMVSGSVLGIDLDSVADVEDALIENEGDLVNPDDTTFAPLSVTALEALQVPLGYALQLPLDTDTGVIGQYAQATSTGAMTGAAGLINDTGVIALEDPAIGYPELGELRLSQLLDSPGIGLGTLLGDNVTDVTLDTGAVAGRAQLDACDAAFQGITADTLSREYLASDVTTTVESPAVGNLVTAVDGVVSGLEDAVNGLAGNESVLSGITGGVSGLLGGLLGALGLGEISATVTAEVDLSGLRNFLAQPFGDDGGVLTIHPSAGTIEVDTAALLANAYPGQYSNGLNGLPPNTNLLSDPAVLTALVGVLGETLDDWLFDVRELLDGVLGAVHLTVDVSIIVRLLLPVAEITASVEGSLADLLGEGVDASAEARLLGLLDLGLLDPLLAALVNGLGGLVGGVVNGVLSPLATIGTTVTDLLQPIITAVSGVYNALFLDGIVSITVNAQNDPATGAGPAEWQYLPDGQYDVSALRVGVLDVLGQQAVSLHLGRASVGTSCLTVNAVGGACPAPVTS